MTMTPLGPLVALALAASAGHLWAEQLRDPTRPPSFAVAPTSADDSADTGLILQTVLLSAERRNAIVSGRLVQVGDTLSGMRVIEIREGAVVLRGNGELRTLRLFPAVEKRSQTPRGAS